MDFKFFPFIVIFCFALLWSRLFYLQIVKAEEISKLASGNRIKIIKIPALRGIIYDKNNKLLVRNRPDGREYVYGSALAHILGYIGEASNDEVEAGLYQLGDLVGKMGIEKQYDRVLRGEDGGILAEVDADGNIIREIKRIEPKTGNNLILAIDLDLQEKASRLMTDRKGAIIISEPKTGLILSLISSPSFEPNLFTIKDEEKLLTELFENADQPMFNRTISGLYPPGSIFKIVTAIAGLESGKINKNTLIEDTGKITINSGGQSYSYSNWYYTQYGKTDGKVDIIKAIERSNDIYFYKTGEWVSVSGLVQWAENFNLGKRTGIDLEGEAEGLVPTPEWKKLQKTESWYLGDTYITAIGQGNLLLTPLQVHQLPSVVAADGFFCQPKLLQSAETECRSLNFKEENLKLIKEGMKRACGENGTAPQFKDFKPVVGCKTGTAEIGDPKNLTHAWFTVFAPWENPEIVITVLLEKAGEGSKEAAPIAKEILEWWFENK